MEISRIRNRVSKLPSSPVSPKAVPRKRKPSLPAQFIQDRSLLSYFLFLTEPVDLSSPVDLPHIQAVKEQIFVAQVHCDALASGNKYKRSTSRNNRVKKLRKRVRWLSSYFLDLHVDEK
jgi:hypothetical protein